MKFLRVICVLALAFCVTANVYAETQNVKVSGDLAVRSIMRANYDYRGSISEPDVTRTNVGTEGDQNWFMSTAEVEIAADMTDNVSTVIRMVNQRDWDVQQKAIAANTTLAQNGLGGYTANGAELAVGIDLAYVTLKDFIYSPLTLTIGRQDLWFGRGFIVGANQRVDNGVIAAMEYTAINSFDAIKAVLDYDPWTITGLYSKIYENAIQANDDVDLFGLNVGYKFDAYKAEAEGYWFNKRDRSVERWGGIKSQNIVHTLGLRGSFDPIEVITVNLEGAFQGGSAVLNRLQVTNRERAGYAIDGGLEWRYLADKWAWKPKLGAEYILYSGEGVESNPATAAGAFEGWDPMYRGKFDSAIREFVGRYYTSYKYPSRANYLISNADASFTNQHQLMFSGSIQPIESLTMKGNLNLFWTFEDIDNRQTDGFSAVSNREPGGLIGTEVDIQTNWDYTEDVSFGLLTGWFIPGGDVYDNADKVATDIVGSVKVNF